ASVLKLKGASSHFSHFSRMVRMPIRISATGRVRVKGKSSSRRLPSERIKFIGSDLRRAKIKNAPELIRGRFHISLKGHSYSAYSSSLVNFLYLFLNLSILPAVSTNLVLPV